MTSETQDKCILAVDVGTTTIRAHVYNSKAEIIGESSRALESHCPKRGIIEIIPDVLWDQFVTTVREAIEDSDISANGITALGISTQRNTFTTWNKKTGEHYHNFISWNDTRWLHRTNGINDSWSAWVTMRLGWVIDNIRGIMVALAAVPDILKINNVDTVKTMNIPLELMRLHGNICPLTYMKQQNTEFDNDPTKNVVDIQNVLAKDNFEKEPLLSVLKMEEEDKEEERKVDVILGQREQLEMGSTEEKKKGEMTIIVALAAVLDRSKINDVDIEKTVKYSLAKKVDGKPTERGDGHRHHKYSTSLPTKSERPSWKGSTRSKLPIILLYIISMMLNLRPALASGAVYCPRNQTIQLGKESIIDCTFPDAFHAVYWNPPHSPNGPALIAYFKSSGEKRGPGFVDKSVDVLDNGSLVISEVRVEDEGTYTAIMYTDPDSFEINNISLTVIVYPGNDFPSLECDDCQHSYYHLDEGSKTLTCHSNMARPPVQLQWLTRYPNEDSVVTGQHFNVLENRDGTYNSSATISLTRNGDELMVVLVCVASWNVGWLRGEIQILLDFSQFKSFSNRESKTVYREVSRMTEVRCEGSGHGSKIWKSISSQREPETVGFTFGEVTANTAKLPGAEISSAGSLIFPQLQLYHEGLYACLYDSGRQNGITMINVEVLVPPSPPYIQIIGCEDNGGKPCEFKEEDTDSVSCAVYGARPNVSLEWIPKLSKHVSFYESTTNVTDRNGTFDVVASTKCKVSGNAPCGEELLIECRMYGPVANIMKADVSAVIIPKPCKTKEDSPLLILLVVITVIVIVLFVIICYVRGHRMMVKCRDGYIYMDRRLRHRRSSPIADTKDEVEIAGECQGSSHPDDSENNFAGRHIEETSQLNGN